MAEPRGPTALPAGAIFAHLSAVAAEVTPDLVAAGALVLEEESAGEGSAGSREACIRVAPGARASLPALMRRLRDDAPLAFDFLQNLTAVDWIKRDAMEVVYHLFSYPHRHTIAVKIDVPRGDARVPSVAAVWPTADWMEREQFDLLGVVFEGHPDLRRLLMPDDWAGHPMRKDYHEPKAYRGMPTSRPSPLDLLQTYDRAHPGAPPVPTPAPRRNDEGDR